MCQVSVSKDTMCISVYRQHAIKYCDSARTGNEHKWWLCSKRKPGALIGLCFGYSVSYVSVVVCSVTKSLEAERLLAAWWNNIYYCWHCYLLYFTLLMQRVHTKGFKRLVAIEAFLNNSNLVLHAGMLKLLCLCIWQRTIRTPKGGHLPNQDTFLVLRCPE